VCGCGDLQIDFENQVAKLRIPSTGEVISMKAGDWLSVNGDTGDILVGKQNLSPANFKGSDDISRFMALVDSKRKMRVLANADTPHDASEARLNGAEGIGLTRTEVRYSSILHLQDRTVSMSIEISFD
jgi:pyruvate,orthophosphate dikinase